MRTIRYHSYGNPEQVLQVGEVAAPPAPGEGEIKVRVLARPIHPGDLLGVAGRYRSPGDTSNVAPGGSVIGFEGAGVVESVGANADNHFTPGMRVAFFPARGAWGEVVNVSASFAVPLPESLSTELGAQLHVIPMTAMLLMRAARAAGAKAGNAMVLTAAGSSVARIVAAIALREGIRVVGVVRSTAGAKALAKLLPDVETIVTEEASWQDQLPAAVGGLPVQTLLDCVGGEVASELFMRLASGGTVISYGDLSGEPLRVQALAFSVRNLRIEGVSVGRWAGQSPEQRAADVRDVLALLADRPDLLPVIATHDLSQVSAAVALATRPGKLGTVLLSSNPS
ncbi:zinc-binding dehydrogenase [Rhodoferax sp.]|uniref:zinc-binding dehydrogenase n=1 Tax=Rhodoferax sp. TaxID=50421 RepID=UPI00374D49BC